MPLADPGYLADVIAGGPLDPDWGNAIRDRATHHFANATDRDANITLPKEGMSCWLADVDQFLVYNGVAWRQPWNMPWGEIVYAEITAPASAISGPGDIAGVTVTFTAVAHRIYVAQAEASNCSTNAFGGGTSLVKVFIADGASAGKSYILNLNMSQSDRAPARGSYRTGALAAGTQTFKMRAVASVGTIQVNASIPGDPGPAFIKVIDMGPNGTAA